MKEYILKNDDIKCAEEILAKGDCAEFRPGPNGAVKLLHVKRKVVRVRREEVKK